MQLETMTNFPVERYSPTRVFLARLHRGEAFTRVFSVVLAACAGLIAVTFCLLWLADWRYTYYEFERWGLVVAFINKFFQLAAFSILVYMTYLRARHLREIPHDQNVVLRAIALICRWLGEFVLVLSLISLIYAFLSVQGSGLLTSSLNLLGLDESTSNVGVKAFTIFASLWFQLTGFFWFTLLYFVAGIVELFLAIEYNTRPMHSPKLDNSMVVGRGREIAISSGFAK